MKSLIKLASAHVTQIVNKGQKSDWIIRANKTEEELGRLPANLTEQQVFSILDTARKFELEAFNIGANFGKKEANIISNKRIKLLESNLKEAGLENERIADALDKATKS